MKYGIVLICLMVSCSVTDDIWFVRQIAGHYQVKNSPTIAFVNSQGNIYENSKLVYQLDKVKTRDWSIYMITDPSKGTGYVPIAYSNAILYIGTEKGVPEAVVIDNMIAYAVKIS